MRLRGILAGYLGLVALSALLSDQGSARASGLLGWLSSAIERALSPGVPAIPDYAGGAGAAGAAGGGGGSAAPKNVHQLPKGTPPSTSPAPKQPAVPPIHGPQ